MEANQNSIGRLIQYISFVYIYEILHGCYIYGLCRSLCSIFAFLKDSNKNFKYFQNKIIIEFVEC